MYSEKAIDRSSERLSLDQGEGHLLVCFTYGAFEWDGGEKKHCIVALCAACIHCMLHDWYRMCTEMNKKLCSRSRKLAIQNCIYNMLMHDVKQQKADLRTIASSLIGGGLCIWILMPETLVRQPMQQWFQFQLNIICCTWKQDSSSCKHWFVIFFRIRIHKTRARQPFFDGASMCSPFSTCVYMSHQRWTVAHFIARITSLT